MKLWIPKSAFSRGILAVALGQAIPCLPAQNLAETAPSTGNNVTGSPTASLDKQIAARRFVDTKLLLWQERLQLQDWSIEIVISRPSDLRKGTLGNVHWDPEKKTARIRVLSPSDYFVSFDRALDDMEQTIVHELIHLRLSSIWQNEPSRSDRSRVAEEDAVVRIAQTLLQLDRK
jgi:hypothetical protein